jgi:hypothetical protein
MKMRRRMVLKGLGGFTLALPMLESFQTKSAKAASAIIPPYAIFLRQANGCAAAQNTDLGAEPEKFWPTEYGALSEATVGGRALDELSGHLSNLLVVGNVQMVNYDYGDGHARGAMQGLTARGPVVAAAGGDSEADGESLDHRIGAELNADGRDSLFMYAAQNNGWLGGACISYRGSNNRRAPLHNPVNAYALMMGIDQEVFAELAARQQSINDLVRDQMTGLMNSPKLSAADHQRLQLHFDSIQDLSSTLSCNLTEQEEAGLDGASAGYDSDIGDEALSALRTHMDIAVLGVACGYTRSVAMQVGSGNDGSTRYTNMETGQLMENYHYISHRRLSHDSTGSVIPNSDMLHHYVDRHFAQAFNYLLDKLAAYPVPSGENLLDCGVSVWYNDNGNGPGHSSQNVPFILAGSAGGFLRNGEYIQASGGEGNHAQLLNTIGSAVGLRNAAGEFLDDFGDPASPKGVLSELLA